jgi:hypothetical protein
MAAHGNKVIIWIQMLLLARLTMAQLAPVCYPSGVVPNSRHRIASLRDRRVQGVMPSTLPLAVLQAEAATYHALFSSIINLQSRAVCGIQPAVQSQQAQATAQNQQQQQQLQQQHAGLQYPAPKGWITKKVIPIKGLFDGKVVDVPTAVILQDAKSHAACTAHSKLGISTSTSQLLVLMRGAVLNTDYTMYAFMSSLVQAPEFGPGLLHQGAGEQQ